LPESDVLTFVVAGALTAEELPPDAVSPSSLEPMHPDRLIRTAKLLTIEVFTRVALL
jgi:hypothetical protein